ncbi:MAG: protein kinase [Cyanobacteria bacterium RI_101]|nr:protein kinase [Cyanobacteria bacterium RI_101]
MDILCTRPGCSRLNPFPELDNRNTLQTAQQKFCTRCGMPLILAGRYLPVKLLGQGGFGAAFLALDRFTPTMRFCVVKQFQPSGDLNPQQMELALSLFEREATVLEELGNRNSQIPNLYAYFPLVVDNPRSSKTDQFFYLVQEFINGKDYEVIVGERGPLPEGEVRWVFTEMLKILGFVHSRNSIHRDIKPSNIMRDQEGKLFLLDFGAVKQVAASSQAAPGGGSTGIYSMGFAPPEQMTGAQVYPATDLYALAVTCLYLLTGKTAQDLYDSYQNQWQWRSSAPGVSPDFADVLDRLLQATPKDRYQSAEETLQALQGQPAPVAPAPKTATTLQAPPQTPVSPPAPQTPVAPAVPAAAPPAPVVKAPPPPLPLTPLLLGAVYTGFQGMLVGTLLAMLIPAPGIRVGLWGMILGGMLFGQWKGWIETWERLISLGATLGLLVWLAKWSQVGWISALQPALASLSPLFNNGLWVALITALFGALTLTAVVSLFLLIYKLLQRLL